MEESGAGVFDVGFVDPKPSAQGRAAQDGFEGGAWDVAAGGAVGADEDDEVVVVGECGFEGGRG